MNRALIFAIAALPALGACSLSKGSGAVDCSDVVLTPGGPAPRACVHEVPNGATVSERDDGTSVVTLNGRVVATYPSCPCVDRNTCMDRNGVAHRPGLPWSDGCQTCSCGDLGDGTLSAVCSHNTCAPDASADGSVDATGGADGVCSACTQAGGGLEACPSDVNTASSCPSPGRACCAGGAQWHCGDCIGEICHWFQSCTPADFDAGGQCNDFISCPSRQTCITGGTCADTCQPDAGTCAAGTSCGTAIWYFNPVIMNVCR